MNWFSTYRVHHRVTQHFRDGRAFLLGDAAHVHSPVGGQGMNTGIGDAINLAWKLAEVLAGRAPDALLDSYEPERIAFARRLVHTTDRIFMLATAEGRLAEIIRTRVVPIVFPAVTRFGFFRGFLFRTVSQIMINCTTVPLSEGRAGGVRGGDRLPWVMVDGRDNYRFAECHGLAGARLRRRGDALRSWCRQQGLPLRELAWRPQYGEAGFAQDALYLIRPDGYVALAEPSGAADVLQRYFAQRGIRIAPDAGAREGHGCMMHAARCRVGELPLLGLPKRGKIAKIRAGSEFIRRISAMFIFSIRTVVLAVAVSASVSFGAAALSVQSELLCSPEGLMRLIPQFNVNGKFTIPDPNADLQTFLSAQQGLSNAIDMITSSRKHKPKSIECREPSISAVDICKQLAIQ